MENIAIAIAGSIGSGKTTVSTMLADKLSAKHGSFGRTVRKIAVKEGLGSERDVLKRLGEKWIEEKCAELCELALADASWTPQDNLVIEGVRHVEAFEALKHILNPTKLILIYLDATDDQRTNRLKGTGVDLEKLRELDSHSTEIQVKTMLRKMADHVVSSNDAPEVIVNRVIALIGPR